jgi:hypothetical protein
MRESRGEPLRVAIVGCGWAGQRHAAACAAAGVAGRSLLTPP